MAKKNEIVFEEDNLKVSFSDKMDLYYFEWEDAIANTGWMHKESAEDWFENQTMIVKQVGWLAVEEENYLGIVSRLSTWDPGETEYGQLQKIPKTWIRKKIKLTKYIK